jgi:hypothetical protein
LPPWYGRAVLGNDRRNGAGSRDPDDVPPDERGGPAVRANGEMRRILEALFRQPRAERSLAVTAAWSRAVGPRIAQVARPIRIVDRRLLVQVTSPTWRNELQMRAGEILRKLQRELGDAVQALDIRVGVNPDLRSSDAPGGATDRSPLPGLRDVARALESPELRAMALALAEGRPLDESPKRKPAARTDQRTGRKRSSR